MMTSNERSKGGTRILGPQEQRQWSQKLNHEVGAKPLVFAKAEDANAPFQISVTNGQSPEGKTLIIQLVKRPDGPPDRAVVVAQHALVDVFGRDAGSQAECDYRDVKELRARMGNEMVNEEHDSLTIIFKPGAITYTRRPEWVRDRLAAELRKWFEASSSW